jgi:uncharacterized protein
MIFETIITTQNSSGEVHIAPMGIHKQDEQFIILPFRPSTTLTNVLSTQTAIINFSDDVRIFAGCLTGRRNWPLKKAEKVAGHVLENTLAHSEVKLLRVEDDPRTSKIILSDPSYS